MTRSRHISTHPVSVRELAILHSNRYATQLVEGSSLVNGTVLEFHSITMTSNPCTPVLVPDVSLWALWGVWFAQACGKLTASARTIPSRRERDHHETVST